MEQGVYVEQGVYMTPKDITKHQICVEISQKHISQSMAAQHLKISLRQMQRIYRAFKAQGAHGIVSKKRGKPSNHQLNQFSKIRILELITCENYRGFGPTFMCEKLKELHGIGVSIETTRQLMIQGGVWHGKKKKSPIIHQQRKPRARSGELLQIDGSPHAWFEDRRDPCVLIVFIDDATGRTFGQFFESETTIAYMITLRKYITKYGKPLTIYSDKYSVFRINKPGCIHKEHLTQFGRALKELDIELIYANSPQAKGRVERVNQTLQDRLVKELRLAQINNIEEANQFLEGYWKEHNGRFARPAVSSEDCHKKLSDERELDKTLCIKDKRKTSKNLEIQYKNTIYQLEDRKMGMQLVKTEVEIWEDLEERIISINYKGKPLKYHEYAAAVGNHALVDSKELSRFLRPKSARKPLNPNHPWLQEGHAEEARRRFVMGVIA